MIPSSLPLLLAWVPARVLARILDGALPALGPVGGGAHAIDVSSWGAIEWAVYGAMALACVWVLWRAVQTTVHPGEEAPDHVKRSILDDDATPFGAASVPPAPTARRTPPSPDAVPPRP